MKPIDIKPKDFETVLEILKTQIPVCEVRAFGSRVQGTARPTSDLVYEAFNQSDLPFKVDLIIGASISEKFRQLIENDFVVVQISNKI